MRSLESKIAVRYTSEDLKVARRHRRIPGRFSVGPRRGGFLCEGRLERAEGFEPSTPTLARLCSTPELRPRSVRDVGNTAFRYLMQGTHCSPVMHKRGLALANQEGVAHPYLAERPWMGQRLR